MNKKLFLIFGIGILLIGNVLAFLPTSQEQQQYKQIIQKVLNGEYVQPIPFHDYSIPNSEEAYINKLVVYGVLSKQLIQPLPNEYERIIYKNYVNNKLRNAFNY
jgi:hypothetical protein